MYPTLSKELIKKEEVGVLGGKPLYMNHPVPWKFFREIDGLPMSFVEQCSEDMLSEDILKYGIERQTNNRTSILFMDGFPAYTVKSHRAFLQYGEVENKIAEVAREFSPLYAEPNFNLSGVTFEGVIPAEKTSVIPITPKVGDALSLKIRIRYIPMVTLESYCDIERLICENGATVINEIMSWKSNASDPGQQKEFITQSIRFGIAGAAKYALRAKAMAATEVKEPAKVLELYSSYLKIPKYLLPALIEHFNVEPDHTEWGIYNAITRAATHDPRFADMKKDLQLACGEWVKRFDVVNARIPRAIAELYS